MKRLLLIVAALLLLGASTARIGAQAQARSDYKIAPGDIVVIDVFGEKEFSREYRVSVTGTINYFFLGEIQVGGRTTSEVRDELTTLLDADYLVEPQVAVDVKDYRIREVFVNGQVTKPGAILITGEQELTILGAIARAGGLTTRASKGKITFTRPGAKERVLSWDQLLERPENNIILQPGDIIEVGDKLF
jgi:protein involved in polysaccharide export with SLBB domain